MFAGPGQRPGPAGGVGDRAGAHWCAIAANRGTCAATAALVSLSSPNAGQVSAGREVSTEHLYRAATDWVSSAEHWEDSFTSVHLGTLSPGGTAWEGQAAEAAQQRTFGDLVRVRGLADTLQEVAGIARRGADQLDYLKRLAVDAISGAREAGFTVGEDLSVTDPGRFGALRVGQAQQYAATIAARATALSIADKEIAAKITTTTVELSNHGFVEPPENRTAHAVDFKQAPPPSPPYPINDVIAEATDLDGMHVVMRRGYYDATTDQGFGWDKAYWRHGVINPNVFRDLISHSRPISNAGGTLVYEVPINRAHCTSGLFGMAGCQDTGESLTMRILANITEGRPDVPDGGQKGVITMFPVKGGSGVVGIRPDWTWTPPWVNNYVPIN